MTHIVKVHQSVSRFSKEFLQKLRRANYVTPKHYLDYINTYLKLLEEKDKFIQSLVSTAQLDQSAMMCSLSQDLLIVLESMFCAAMLHSGLVNIQVD